MKVYASLITTICFHFWPSIISLWVRKKFSISRRIKGLMIEYHMKSKNPGQWSIHTVLGFAYFLGSPWERFLSFSFMSLRQMAADSLCFTLLLCEPGKLWNLPLLVLCPELTHCSPDMPAPEETSSVDKWEGSEIPTIPRTPSHPVLVRIPWNWQRL